MWESFDMIMAVLAVTLAVHVLALAGLLLITVW
jgi:hypothetical protein